jgi:MFS transporter, DHA2 family, multidrug resistance protein
MATDSDLERTSSPGDLADETQGLLAPAFASLTYHRKLAILLTAALITSVEISNRVSINVILPDMQGNVAADADQISWVLILYNIGFICSMILTPWMTRVFGARRHFTICTALYTAGALGCFLSAHNLTTLLASRVVMGLGGGFFLVRLIIMAGLMFPGKARLVPLTWAYLILFSMQIFYPPAIGALSDNFHWNYAFLLDLPFLLVGILLLRRVLPPGHLSPKPPRVQGEDFWGAGFIIFALVALQIATSRGERDLWFESPLISVSFVLFLLASALFIWWDSRPESTSAVLHLRHIYQLPPVRRALVSSMIVGALLGGGLYVIPQYLRNVQDYSAMQTGEFFSFFGLGFGVGALLALRVVVPRFGQLFCAILGMGLLALTFIGFVYSWTPSTPTWLMALMLCFQGISQGLAVIAVAVSVTGRLTARDIWEGDTTYFFVRQLGNTFGLTAVTVLVDRRMTLHSSHLLDVANRLDPTTSAKLSSYADLIARAAGAGTNPQLGALQLFQNNVITQSRLLAYIDVSAFLALVCAAGVIAAVAQKSKSAPRSPSFSVTHL